MSQESSQVDVMRKRVAYRAPGIDRVRFRRDVEYAGTLTMDLYYPPESKSNAEPAVIIVAGYAGPLKEIGWFKSWGELLAASGMVSIAYSAHEPANNVQQVLQYLQQNAASLGIDAKRIGVLACSGHVPNALSILMEKQRSYLKAAVLCYGFTLDLGDSIAVAEAAKTYGFVNPCAGKTVDDLPQNLPLFVVRAGQDQFPGINEAMDRFAHRALNRNLPITLVNYAGAPHGFDLFDESEQCRAIIRQMLAFLALHLLV